MSRKGAHAWQYLERFVAISLTVTGAVGCLAGGHRGGTESGTRRSLQPDTTVVLDTLGVRIVMVEDTVRNHAVLVHIPPHQGAADTIVEGQSFRAGIELLEARQKLLILGIALTSETGADDVVIRIRNDSLRTLHASAGQLCARPDYLVLDGQAVMVEERASVFAAEQCHGDDDCPFQFLSTWPVLLGVSGDTVEDVSTRHPNFFAKRAAAYQRERSRLARGAHVRGQSSSATIVNACGTAVLDSLAELAKKASSVVERSRGTHAGANPH